MFPVKLANAVKKMSTFRSMRLAQ